MKIYYFYPQWHQVSFTFVARQYIRMLRRLYNVEEIDEQAFDTYRPSPGNSAFIHPFLYIAGRKPDSTILTMMMFDNSVAVDVADSDALSVKAVSLINYASHVIVPSTFAKNVYVNSGVRVPVYVVPHALQPVFTYPERFKCAYDWCGIIEKARRRYKTLLLYALWHSEWRKGADLVADTVGRLARERRDFALVARTASPVFLHMLEEREVPTVAITSFLSYEEMTALYDACDVYLLFSRGGGFELNGLEALARGEVVIASRGGSWEDYLPSESLVPAEAWEPVFRNNPYHTGLGPRIDVEKAVDKLHAIIDDIDEWRVRASEHAMRVRRDYSEDAVAQRLLEVTKNIFSK